MRFSVVIPTYNRVDSLRYCLEAIFAQSLPPYEVIVVDDASTDPTNDLVQTHFPHVKYIRQPTQRGPATARNCGIQAASGDIIAFTDDDCHPPANWLAKLAAGLEKYPRSGAVGGVQIPAEQMLSKHILARYEAFVTRRVYAVGTSDVVGKPAPGGTNNLAIPRRVLHEIGAFDERFPVAAGEDADLLYRIAAAGYVTVCLPAPVYHFPDYSWRRFYRQQLHRGVGEAYFLQKYGRQRPLLREVTRLILSPFLFFVHLIRYRDPLNSLVHTLAGFLRTIGRLRSRPAVAKSPKHLWQQQASPVKQAYLQRYAVGGTALDVGAGAGFYVGWLAQRGFQVAAVDRYPSGKIGPTAIQADLTALPFHLPFDTVICFDVLEHVADEASALAELRRVTKQRLLLSVPNADDQILHQYNLTYKHHVDKTHFREYLIAELGDKLAQNGFAVTRIALEGPVHPALFAEFVRPRWLQPLFRFLITVLRKVRLLRNEALKADIFVVAEPDPSHPASYPPPESHRRMP